VVSIQMETVMKLTLSVIKAEIGSIGGHIARR
jgi:fructose 1,6-bisphosphatase